MPTVTLYTRARCHLCDDAKVVIESVRREHPFQLDVIDVDSDASLRELYGLEVPVIAIDGRKAFKYRLTADALREKLQRASAS